MFALAIVLLAATPKPSADVEQLKAQVAQLQRDNAALKAEADELTARVAVMEQRFAAKDERVANEAKARAEVETVVVQLATTGDRKGVAEKLKAAEALASPQAARFIATARQAFARDDLANARAVLTLYLVLTAP